jgi:hypothetical protein
MRVFLGGVAVAATSATGQQATAASALAVQTTSSSAEETPDRFGPLVGRWRYDENVRFLSTFEVLSVNADGVGVIKDYRVGGRPVPQATFVVSEDGGQLRVKIQLGEGAWDLTYSKGSGGMLSGQLTLTGGRAPVTGRFYREK